MDYLTKSFMPDDFDVHYNPFSSAMDTPVYGRDLMLLSQQLEFSVVDAAWFFGTTIAAWYEYTTDPSDKLKNKFQKKIDKVISQRARVLDKLSSGPDEALYEELQILDGNLKGIEAERDKALLKQVVPSSKRSLDQTVEMPLALLWRVASSMPFLAGSVSLNMPDIQLFKTLIDRNNACSEFSTYLGRDANAGYRWLKNLNPPSPTIKRLMHALLLWFHMADDDRVDERVKWWIAVVESEHKLLGRELGKGVARVSLSTPQNTHQDVGL